MSLCRAPIEVDYTIKLFNPNLLSISHISPKGLRQLEKAVSWPDIAFMNHQNGQETASCCVFFGRNFPKQVSEASIMRLKLD
jgi:hypothetical protein